MKKGCSIIAVIGLIVFLIGGYFGFNFLKKYKLGNVAKEGYILVPTGANFEQVLDSISPYLKNNEILAVFHYISLHKSPFYQVIYKGNELPEADRFTDTLVRLPLFYELNFDKVIEVLIKLEF